MDPLGILIGWATMVTVALFVLSLLALGRNPGFRSVVISLALGLFSMKNLILTVLFIRDDLPDIHPVMFADVVVAVAILIRLHASGTRSGGGERPGEEEEEEAEAEAGGDRERTDTHPSGRDRMHAGETIGRSPGLALQTVPCGGGQAMGHPPAHPGDPGWEGRPAHEDERDRTISEPPPGG